MAKRFTDQAKWGKPWFRKLPPKYKVLWDYLYTNCNQIGVWDVDMETASHFIGAKVTEAEALPLFAEQVLQIDGGKKWFLPGFVPFQYNKLTPNNNFHIALIAQLDALAPLLAKVEKSGANQPLLRGSAEPIYKEKDKDKEEGGMGVPKPFSEFVWLAAAEHQKLSEKMQHHLPAFIDRLNGYIGQIGAKKAAAKYKSHYHTILNWYRKDIEEGKIRPPQTKPAPHPRIAEIHPPDPTAAEIKEMHDAKVRALGTCRVKDCAFCGTDKK